MSVNRCYSLKTTYLILEAFQILFQTVSSGWGGSRGGSVEPPKLNVKTYNKRVVKKKVNQLS